MIFINGNWEKVSTLDEAYQIIRDNLGAEFASIIDNIRELIGERF